MLFPILPVYRQNETAGLVVDSSAQDKIRSMSIRDLARTAGLSTRTVRAARKGRRIRKSTALKLERAVHEHKMEGLDEQEKLEPDSS